MAYDVSKNFNLMNTPSHYILNLAFLGQTIAPKQNVAITIGALLPDIPIFLFYAIAKYIYKLPESKIWSEAYYEPLNQNIVALSHSIPLAVIGCVICYFCKWEFGMVLCASMVCHSLLDLPVHNDDAHRHFYPFSNYRFISPFSYWDIKHFAKYVAGFEVLLVLIANPFVMMMLKSPWTKGIVVLVDLVYVFGYTRFYLFR